jgi:hypothetical protein
LSAQALVAAACAFAGLRDTTGGAIPGSFVDTIRRQAGRGGVGSWDVALVHHWGFWSQFDLLTESSAWPLDAAETAAELCDGAVQRGMIAVEPRVGDIYAQYSPARREFVRVGVVGHVGRYRPPGAGYWDIVSIEGNSGERGELAGSNVVRIVRRFSPELGDRCIRWTRARTRESARKTNDRRHWRSRAVRWAR